MQKRDCFVSRVNGILFGNDVVVSRFNSHHQARVFHFTALMQFMIKLYVSVVTGPQVYLNTPGVALH